MDFAYLPSQPTDLQTFIHVYGMLMLAVLAACLVGATIAAVRCYLSWRQTKREVQQLRLRSQQLKDQLDQQEGVQS